MQTYSSYSSDNINICNIFPHDSTRKLLNQMEKLSIFDRVKLKNKQ